MKVSNGSNAANGDVVIERRKDTETRRSDRLPRPPIGRRWEGVVGSTEAIVDGEIQTSLRPKNAPWNKGRITGQKRPPKPRTFG
jgi:hypothetical protein